MNVPKISLKSTIDKTATNQSVTNQITINTNSTPDIKADYQGPIQNRNIESTPDLPIFQNPYDGISRLEPEVRDCAQFEACQVSGLELDELIKQNKNLKAINKASEIIIEMMKNNPIYVSALIITDDIKLAELVKILTDATTINIDSEIMFTSCCGAYEYRKVNAIYVIKGDKTLNLKYDFPEVTKRLKDLGINSKFVF